jgi:hypothetical protein
MSNFDIWWYYASLTPFYAGLQMKFMYNISNSNKANDRYKLFGIIPILKIKTNKLGNKIYYKLFNIIPILIKKINK